LKNALHALWSGGAALKRPAAAVGETRKPWRLWPPLF
jgi:hypothetical protein